MSDEANPSPSARDTRPGSGPWRKSSRSKGASNCVELAALPGGQVAVRNSRHPDESALVYTRAGIAALVAGAKSGDFEQPARV